MVDLQIYLSSRYDGEAHLEIVPDVGPGAPVYDVWVLDDGDPLIAPLLQRAVEEAGYHFEVENYAAEDDRSFIVPVPDGVARQEPPMPDLNKEAG